jgi:hypothetical protein
MWIILLDRSGSMGDPFVVPPEDRPPGRFWVTEAATKWLAAKAAVLEEVAGLDPAEEVCVISFDEAASLTFEGRAGDAGRLRSALDALTPDGGTDVAAALDAAGEHMGRCGADATTSVEVVSDGLSELDKAQAAAGRLGERAGRIDVVLIDPTTEGQAVARAVAVRGRVFSVSGAAELRRDTGEAVSRHLAEQERLRGALARIDAEHDTVVAAVPTPERLSMTAGYPGEPLVGLWYPLTLFLHVAAMREEVRRRMEAIGRHLGRALDEATTQLSLLRGTWLTLTPRCEGVTFNPASQEVAWHEDVQEVAFRFCASSEVCDQLLLGTIEACVKEGLPIARVGFSLRVQAEGANGGEMPWVIGEAEMFRSVFASYAHVDGSVVQRCAAAYRALGIKMYIDRDALLAGQAWHPALLSLIDRADAFQLYWSKAARDSTEVEKEWRHALTLRNSKGERFLRGLYWTIPILKPPDALSDTHFGFLDLAALDAESPVRKEETEEEEPARSASGTSIPSSTQEAQRAREIAAVVLPLVAGETRRSLTERRRDVATALAFLEAMTGLRPNAIPTILVDELTVREVRRRMSVVDDTPAAQADPKAVAAMKVWDELLRAQLLDFHVSTVPTAMVQSKTTQVEDKRVPPLPANISKELFASLKGFAEGALSSWLRELSTYPWQDQNDDANVAPECDLPDVLSLRVIAVLDRNLAAAQRTRIADSGRTRTFSFRPNTSSYASGLDENLAWQAVRAEPSLEELRSCEKVTEKELVTSLAVLVRALSAMRGELAAALPAYDACSYVAAEGPDAGASRCLALAICAGTLLDQLYWELPDSDRVWSDRHLGDLVADVVYPSWRRARDVLRSQGAVSMRQALDFKSFVAAYLNLMSMLFRHWSEQWPNGHWSGGYAISKQTWEIIQRELRPAVIETPRRESGWRKDDELLLGGPFTAFVELFEAGSQRLLAAIDLLRPRRAARTRLAEEALEVAAHGIFVPAANAAADAALAAWASRRGIPPQVVLPDTPRVVFRATALSGADDNVGRRRLLERCTLVHEYFHAVVETGLDARFRPARGPRDDPESWERATALNESLAAWMEVQFLRRHAASLGTPEEVEAAQSAVWAYVRAGDYPNWPYRGAEAVEALHSNGGIEAVRDLVLRLREDPGGTIRDFTATFAQVEARATH